MEKSTLEEAIGLLENFFMKWYYENRRTINPVIANALQAINQTKGRISILELTKAVCVTEKTLQRHFLNDVGLTPKLFTRVHKFNEVIWHYNTHKNITGSDIIQLGYFDQAHFIKDFKTFSGSSPRNYFKNHDDINEFFTS